MPPSEKNKEPLPARPPTPKDDATPLSDSAAGVAPPHPLSVDQLTQAFAQLMGQATPNPAAEDDESAGEPGTPAVDEAAPTPAAIVEAILFVGHPENQLLSNRLVAGYLRGVSPTEVDDLIVQLNAAYQQQNAPYQIVSEGAGYQLTLRPEFSRLRDRFYGRVRQARLSQAALDLLAIVAYHQPIAREEIDRMRGTPSGAVLRQLVRRELLSIQRSTQKPIRTFFRTTDRFLDLFGLQSLDDLPRHEDFLRD